MNATLASTMDDLNRAGEAIRLNSGMTVSDLSYVVGDDADSLAGILILLGFVRLVSKKLEWID